MGRCEGWHALSANQPRVVGFALKHAPRRKDEQDEPHLNCSSMQIEDVTTITSPLFIAS